MEFILLITGITGLWIGTEATIGGALAIAKRQQLSEFIVGLVILSIGSDLPELAVSVDAGLKSLMGLNTSGVVVGSAIGSVLAQIGFVLGLAGLIGHLTLPRRFIYRHGAILIGATVVLFLVAYDGEVSRIEGLTLITLYVIYVFVLMKGEEVPEEVPEPLAEGGIKSWALLLLGLVTVFGCSELTVRSVLQIAHTFGISDALISVLAIGIGTSLPELSISISAISKKKTHLSVGNIIGSNILDTLLPIGVAAVISPVLFDQQFLGFDLPYVLLLTFAVLVFFVSKRGMQKSESAVILGLYLSYVLIKLVQ